MDDLKSRARKEFNMSLLDESQWTVFWVGYLAAVKRFGGKR